MMSKIKEKIIKRGKKKKGFTLIELLAVIVILAVIMVITIPTVLGSMNKAKQSAFNTVGETMIKYLENNYKKCMLGNGNIVKFDDSIFNPDCSLKTEDLEKLSNLLIENSGYNTNDIASVEVNMLEEGEFGVIVHSNPNGKFGSVEDSVEGRAAKQLVFNNLGDDINKFLEDNYRNCKDNKDFNKTIFTNDCKLQSGDLSKYIIENSGNKVEDIGTIEVKEIEDGKFDIVIYPNNDGKFNDVDIYIKGTYDDLCWQIKSLDNNEYALTNFYVLDNDDDYGEDYIKDGCEQYMTTKNDADDNWEMLSMTLPSKVKGKKITTISSDVFSVINENWGCDTNSGDCFLGYLPLINIEEGIKVIEKKVFQYSGRMLEDGIVVKLPKSLEVIGEAAFSNSKIKSINIEEVSKLKRIENAAFIRSGDLTNSPAPLSQEIIIIPKNVTYIGETAFALNLLKQITFEGAEDGTSKLEYIGKGAFSLNLLNYPEDSPLIIPSSVTFIGNQAFVSFPPNKVEKLKFFGDSSSFEAGWNGNSGIIRQ